MCRVILLWTVGVVLVMGQPDKGGNKCGRLMHGGLACCKKDMDMPNAPPPDYIKECFQKSMRPPSCDLEICIAMKKGFGKEDGTIDKKAMAASVESTFESDPNLADSIKDNCVNGDLSKYGPSDMCDLMKAKMCTDVQIIKSCDEWNDAGDCNGMKDLAAECIKNFE